MYVDWKLQIHQKDIQVGGYAEMHEIYSVAYNEDDTNWMFACGYKWQDPNNEISRNAVTMKMNTDGDIEFLDVWGN